ncbi:MAG: thiamine phosphate synthase [bacterium]|nr:thiamine phosphate synthase [bacterium]
MNVRMIDVNLNRICEALRVLEDINRFYFNDKNTTLLLKKTRQEIRSAFPAGPLLLFRDVDGDTGKFLNTKKEFDRPDLSGVITANAKRIQESCRVLEELLKLKEQRLSSFMKKTRFFSYELEKEMLASLAKTKKKLDLSFYAILDLSLLPPEKAITAGLILARAGVTMLQIRAKMQETRVLYETGLKIKKILKKFKVPFIINDRIDLAVALDADGVHVGRNDLNPGLIRTKFHYQGILGYSASSEKEIIRGIRYRADYIGLGPVFPTATKPDAAKPMGLDRASLLYRSYNPKIPVVVIGGISRETIPSCLKKGIRNFSLISALLEPPSFRETARCLKSLIKGEKQ